jgi:uncharacterized protein (DUF488 family)
VRLWSIGHSTRPLDELLGLLSRHGLRAMADVRKIPRSARHPWFAREALERSLPAVGVEYRWLGASLGGLRRAAPGSRNSALRSPSFRAYADHMASPEFREGVDELLALGRRTPTAFLCAEAVWWRCHRSFLADHLVGVLGVEVLHVIDTSTPKPHALRKEARVEDGALVYDAAGPSLFGEIDESVRGTNSSL